MYNEWNLDIFYKGIDDPQLCSDMQKIEELVAAYKEMIASLNLDDPKATLRKVIELDHRAVHIVGTLHARIVETLDLL